MDTPQAPVLSETEQKHTLSGKKNKNKKESHGRIVFASPYDSYWPVLKKEAESNLNKLLSSALEPLKKPVVKVNWSDMRKMPRERRREMRRKLEAQVGPSSDYIMGLRKCLCLGVNAVTRGLEAEAVGCVLLALDADPTLLISHIPTMCAMQGVPVLIMPALRSITKSSLGFVCLALGMKRAVVEMEGGCFYAVYRVVSDLCGQIPVPEPLPAFRSAPMQDEQNTVQEQQVKVSKDLYMYRSSRKERVFVPGLPPAPDSSVDFLAFGTDISANSSLTTNKGVVVPLGNRLEKRIFVQFDEPMDVQEEENFPSDNKKSAPSEFHYRPLRLKITCPNPKKVRKKEMKKKRKN